jgi:peptidoglycan/xylan/chitin deacetylase (PgdA/CDA1 family)
VPRWFPAEFSWVIGSTLGIVDRDTDVRNVWGGNMLVRRQAFLDAGGFRTGFGKLGTASQPEDTELCVRMTACAAPGARWRFVSDAVVLHQVPAERGTWSFFLRRCWSEGTGKHAVSLLAKSRAEVLDEEVRFVVAVLTRGVSRNLIAVLRGDLFGLTRAAAIVLGTAAATAGFVFGAGLTAWRRRSKLRRTGELDESARCGLTEPALGRHAVVPPVASSAPGTPATASFPSSVDATGTPVEPSADLERIVRHRHGVSQDPVRRSRAIDSGTGMAQWRLPILMYHSVTDGGGPSVDPQAVSVSEFERQLAALSSGGWTVVGVTEALALLGLESSRRVVALTFDDGLSDFLNAVEVLQRYGARATAYIPTAAVGSRSSHGRHDGARLSWSELTDLSRARVEMGSHSVSHRPLDILPIAEVTRELVDSKKLLEDHLGVPVSSFCYPHGYSSPRVSRLVQRAGYANACVVGRRIALSTDDRKALPRLQVRPGGTGDSFDELVRFGEPGLMPLVKQGAMPVWRLTRFMVSRLLNRQLT